MDRSRKGDKGDNIGVAAWGGTIAEATHTQGFDRVTASRP